MRKNQFTFNNTWLLLPITIGAFLLTIISSCNGKHSKVPTCVKLTKTQINKWVKKGYTDTTNKDYIASVRFKTAYAFTGTVFRVYALGVRKDGSVINESLTELMPVDTCKKEHIKLSDYIFSGMIPATLSELAILKPNGQPIDSLEYVYLRPYDWNDPKNHYDFMAYDFSIVKTGGVVTQPTITSSRGVGLPCPPCPNCPVTSCPKPSTCEVCGPSIVIDTLDN